MEDKKIVISQPMYIPWSGMFNQLQLCDSFVYYDDVEFPNSSSFINRIQVRSKSGVNWLSIPIDKKNSGKLINETLIAYDTNWQEKHQKTLIHAYRKAKYYNDLIEIIDEVYTSKFETISNLNIFCFNLIAKYFSLDDKTFIKSSELNIEGKSSQRLLDIVKYLKGNIYITGHGAKNYLNHEIFDCNDVKVNYINYNIFPYHQQFMPFNPYVSILDLIANEGKDGVNYLNSEIIYWKIFLKDFNNE